MAVNAFPLDPAAGAPQYSAQMTRQALSALCGVAPSGRPLGASSGVRPGTPATTVVASGLTITVHPHSGVVDLETAAAAGPYFYWVDADITRTLGAASGSNPRIDLISVVTNDPTQDSSSVPTADIVVTQGTPAATPAVPATPTGAFPLAQINVPQSGTGSPSVTWVAATFSTLGIQITADWNASATSEGIYYGDAGTGNAPDGHAYFGLVFPRASGALQVVFASVHPQAWMRYLNGGTWSAWFPILNDTGWITTGVTGSGGSTITGVNLRSTGSPTSINMIVTLGSSAAFPSSGNIVNKKVATLPAAFRPTVAQGVGSGGTGAAVTWLIDTDGSVYLVSGPPGYTAATGVALTVAGMILLG